MRETLIDILRGGVPALGAFLIAVFLVRVLCRRSVLRRLTLALSLCALAGSVALFRWLVPTTADRIGPFAQFLFLFVLAYTTFKVVEVLVLDVLPIRRGRVPPPAILRDIVAALFAGVILVLLLRASFGVDVTALVATSAALSIVLGLALQETLSNLFAGLALMIERPFESGDWVRIGDRIGTVKEVSWRAIKIQILNQEDYLIIPNSVAGKSEIVNMSQPTPLHGQSVEVGVVYGEPPNRVRQVLIDAALEVSRVLRAPAPRVEPIRFDNFAIVYRLTFWVNDFAHLLEIEGDVLSHIWYAFRRQDIKIPFPVQDVYLRDATQLATGERRREVERVAFLLRGVDFLEALTQEQLERLAGGVQIAPFPRGLAVVKQGDAGDSLFVIASGRVEVFVQPPGGGPERVLAVIEAGNYFGEMSLLTGAPRSATIRTLEDTELLVLTRDALRPVLLSDPAAAERLSQTLAKRQAEREDVIHRVATPARGPDTDLAGLLLGGIRRFFGLIGGDAGARP